MGKKFAQRDYSEISGSMNLSSPKWTLSYPSKTFLVGEYAVLHGAPAVLVNTFPQFKFHIDDQDHSQSCPFHEDSPAYFFMEKNKEFFVNISISVQDPYQGLGGFGLSSAEFNCVYDLFLKQRNLKCRLNQLWKIYKGLSKGSGADVISQRIKGVCLFQPDPFQAESIQWPFYDLSFALVRAGEKHPTSSHLNDLNFKAFPLLTELSMKAVESMRSFREDIFIDCVREYGEVLDQLKLVSENSFGMIQELRKNKDILCSKGCGAMGAEVIAVFFKKEKEKKVLEFLKTFRVEAVLSDLDYGQ